ncbi:MAG: purine-binding chemotaxis protein CheW [Bdellovibrionaceae bacterium]|nr:purine-binding chemotaxis protein CheW [Pseudobdellovibrionaceae bacterium]
MSSEEKKENEVQAYLRFSLAKEHYALPLLSVKEVIAMPEVTQLPNTPKHFMGIMNLRGQIISIIDLRAKFQIKNEFNPETTVIICDMKPFCMGIVVNSVDSVLSVKSEDIKPKPEIDSHKSTDYITGVVNYQEDLILLIDIAKALDVADHNAIQSQTGKVA